MNSYELKVRSSGSPQMAAIIRLQWLQYNPVGQLLKLCPPQVLVLATDRLDVVANNVKETVPFGNRPFCLPRSVLLPEKLLH